MNHEITDHPDKIMAASQQLNDELKAAGLTEAQMRRVVVSAFQEYVSTVQKIYMRSDG
jgi:hypothetical protein